MRRLLLCVLLASVAVASPALASQDRLFDIASILSGTFEGSTPGNHLRLDLRSLAVDPQHPFDLFLQVSGQFEKDNIHQ